jgi:hypothetical protein
MITHSPKPIAKYNPQTTIRWINHPIGRDGFYSFRTPDNLDGYLTKDVDARTHPVVKDLRAIVTAVRSNIPIETVQVNAGQMETLYQKVWEMVTPLDGHLGMKGLTSLDYSMGRILRLKYEVVN